MWLVWHADLFNYSNLCQTAPYYYNISVVALFTVTTPRYQSRGSLRFSWHGEQQWSSNLLCLRPTIVNPIRLVIQEIPEPAKHPRYLCYIYSALLEKYFK